jgi:hypothetical protein
MSTVSPPTLILQALNDSLTRAMRMSIQPLIEELRNDIEKLIKTKNGELYSTVCDKISQTLGVLEMTRARMSGMAVASLATTTTRSHSAAPVRTLAKGNPHPALLAAMPFLCVFFFCCIIYIALKEQLVLLFSFSFVKHLSNFCHVGL